MSKQGVPADKFRQVYNSQDVSTKVMRAEELSRSYGVSSVPQFAVDGQYVVLAENATTIGAVLSITQEVIDKATKDAGRK
jgi:protein dithiol oxidoreductase (disulfide-forming)